MTQRRYDNASWFTGTCINCGYNVVVTQPTQKYADYWWYCSNKLCEHHSPGQQTGDMEIADFVDVTNEKDRK